MMMDCEVAEEERRDSFIYPLVFIFCFEKWAELGAPIWVEGARRMMGEVDLEDERGQRSSRLSRNPSAVLQETGG